MKQKYIIPLFALLAIIIVFSMVIAQEKSCCQNQEDKSCCQSHADKSCCKTQKTSIEQTSQPNQTKCPVMGGEINKEIYADHNGKRVYFCCQACIETFKKDAESYLKKMEEEGIIPDKTPKNKVS